MSCGYHINHEEGLVTITGTTDVDIRQACQLGNDILQDPGFDPELPQLVDLRGLLLHRSAESSVEFRDFVLTRYRPSVNASMAIVIDETLDQMSVASLYHLSCNMPKTELFDQYEQALKWLMRHEFASEMIEPLRLDI